MNEDKKTEDICEKLREATGTKNMSTDRTSKKLQTNHIKMKAEELTQDDFSNENCCDDENCEEPKRNTSGQFPDSG